MNDSTDNHLVSTYLQVQRVLGNQFLYNMATLRRYDGQLNQLVNIFTLENPFHEISTSMLYDTSLVKDFMKLIIHDKFWIFQSRIVNI